MRDFLKRNKIYNKNTIQIATYIGIATLNCRDLVEYRDSVQRENFDSHIGYIDKHV